MPTVNPIGGTEGPPGHPSEAADRSQADHLRSRLLQPGRRSVVLRSRACRQTQHLPRQWGRRTGGVRGVAISVGQSPHSHHGRFHRRTRSPWRTRGDRRSSDHPRI